MHNTYHDEPGQPWGRDWTRHVRPPGPPPSAMRVSNVERTEVTNALCRHFGDGRLDEAELNDRLALAAAAKTRADLAPLLADLPSLEREEPAPRPARPPRRVGWIVLAVLVVVAMAGAVAHTTAAIVHVPWLLVALVVWLVLRRSRHHHQRF
jgi:hypothetical protein